MKKIKIGQVGVCHEHASGKMITMKLMSDVFEIVGVVDDRETSVTPRHEVALHSCYEGIPFIPEEELLNTPGLQAVAVEVPNNELVPTALRCMDRNLPMHMDKPGGEDLELFTKLRKGCADRNLPFQMGYMFRGNPAIRWCQEAIKKGLLGDIFEIQANMSHNYGDEAYQEYLGKFKGGIMYNLGCHLIDLVVEILGRPTAVSPFLKSAPGWPDSVKNNCVTILEYPNCTATIHACSLEVDGLHRRRLKICGTNGSVELSPLERFDGNPLLMNLSLKEAIPGYEAGNHTVDFGIVRDRYESQLLELARIINGETADPTTYEHDYLVQEVVLAASGYTTWRKTI